jgi:hypothetical protein
MSRVANLPSIHDGAHLRERLRTLLAPIDLAITGRPDGEMLVTGAVGEFEILAPGRRYRGENDYEPESTPNQDEPIETRREHIKNIVAGMIAPFEATCRCGRTVPRPWPPDGEPPTCEDCPLIRRQEPDQVAITFGCTNDD